MDKARLGQEYVDLVLEIDDLLEGKKLANYLVANALVYTLGNVFIQGVDEEYHALALNDLCEGLRNCVATLMQRAKESA